MIKETDERSIKEHITKYITNIITSTYKTLFTPLKPPPIPFESHLNEDDAKLAAMSVQYLFISYSFSHFAVTSQHLYSLQRNDITLKTCLQKIYCKLDHLRVYSPCRFLCRHDRETVVLT